MIQQIRKSFKKITKKVNKRVIIGFTGDYNQCNRLSEMILNDNSINDNSFADDIISFIKKFLSEIPQKINVGIAICGIDRKGKICAGVMHTIKESKILYPHENKPVYFELPPNGVSNEVNIFGSNLSICNNPKEAAEKTINYYSHEFPSVNNEITFECIDISQF